MKYGYDTQALSKAQAGKGLTNSALAILAKVSPSTVARAMDGGVCTPTTMRKIAGPDALDVNLADITIPMGSETKVTPEGSL